MRPGWWNLLFKFIGKITIPKRRLHLREINVSLAGEFLMVNCTVWKRRLPLRNTLKILYLKINYNNRYCNKKCGTQIMIKPEKNRKEKKTAPQCIPTSLTRKGTYMWTQTLHKHRWTHRQKDLEDLYYFLKFIDWWRIFPCIKGSTKASSCNNKKTSINVRIAWSISLCNQNLLWRHEQNNLCLNELLQQAPVPNKTRVSLG